MNLLIVATSSYDDPLALEWHPDLRLTVSYLRANGVDAGYIYMPSAGRADELVQFIGDAGPVVLFLHLSEENRTLVMELARACRVAFPKLLVMAGGIPATLDGEALLRDSDCFDYAVLGEREAVLLSVVERIRCGRDLNDLPGLQSRTFRNPAPALMGDLDALGMMVLDGVPDLLGLTAFLRSSRGCYGRCSFCGVPGFYGNSHKSGWRGRSPGIVVDEMEELSHRFGTHDFVFEDDDFIGPGEAGRMRARRFADEIVRRGLKVRYSVCCRLNDVDRPTLEAMKQSGLAAVGVSVESANQSSLNLFRKGQKADAIYGSLGLFEELEIPCEVNLIFFDPYLTLAGARANLELLRYVQGSKFLSYSDAFPFCELMAFPWTPVSRQLRGDGLLVGDGPECRYRDPLVGALASFVRRLRQRIPINFKCRTLFLRTDDSAAEAMRTIAPGLRNWVGLVVLPRYVDAACDLLEDPSGDAEGGFAELETKFEGDIAFLREMDGRLASSYFLAQE